MRRGTQASAAPGMSAPWSAGSRVDVRIESSRLRIAASWGNIVLNRLIPLVRASCVVLLASACAPQSDTADPAQARFCESVESGHSSHNDAARIAGVSV